MTIYQCPKCELRFTWKTELDDHCSHDHPQFRHEYPARKGESWHPLQDVEVRSTPAGSPDSD
jgi:hypothetical protein